MKHGPNALIDENPQWWFWGDPTTTPTPGNDALREKRSTIKEVKGATASSSYCKHGRVTLRAKPPITSSNSAAPELLVPLLPKSSSS